MDPVLKLQQEIKRMEKAQREQQTGVAETVEAVDPAATDTNAPVPAAPVVAGPAPPAAAAAPEPTAVPAVVVEEPNSDTYKARWETLQGQHRKLQQQYGELLNDNGRLRQQIEAQQPAPAAVAAMTPALDAVKEKYGAEFVDAMMGLFRSELKPLGEQVESVKAETVNSAQARLDSSLDSLAPNWRDLRHDSNFCSFIEQIAPGTGVSYQTLLADAYYTQRDPKRAAEIFNLYKPIAPVPATDNLKPAPVVPPAPPAAMIDPARRGNGSAVITEPQGKTFTQSQVDQYYKDLGKIAGKYVTPPAMVQMGKEIDAAAAAGRIIPG